MRFVGKKLCEPRIAFAYLVKILIALCGILRVKGVKLLLGEKSSSCFSLVSFSAALCSIRFAYVGVIASAAQN